MSKYENIPDEMTVARVKAIYDDCKNVAELNFIGCSSLSEKFYLTKYKFFDIQLRTRGLNFKFSKSADRS